jgi:hypothetical protein
MKRWFTVLAAALCMAGGAARAADHRDGPAVTAPTGDPTIDITDVYAWMSADGTKVYLVMDVQGADLGATTMTKFSNTALYALHLTSGTKFLENTNPDTIICRFTAETTQKFQCWGPGTSPEYVTGEINNKAGYTSTSGKMKVFAGVRNDPFFFNIRGFRATGSTVKSVAGTLMFDPAGCPKIDSMTSGALVGLLKSNGMGGAGTDDFGKMGAAPVKMGDLTNGNILSIAIVIDKSLITAGGKIVGVWGSTNMPK